MIRALLIATALLSIQTVARADVYRWVDAQGRVQYSDRWVPGSELVKVDRSKSNPEAVAARQAVEQGRLSASNAAIAERQAADANAQAVKQDVAKAREEQCKKAKERYERVIQLRRLYKENKDGTREYLSDADADAYRLKSRTEMQEACGNAAQ